MKVVKIDGDEGFVESGGLKKRANFSLMRNVKPGDYILLGSSFYEILSVGGPTTLTLVQTYRGTTLSAVTYVAQSMNNGICLQSFIAASSTTTGIALTSTRLSAIRNIVIDSCLGSILMTDCGTIECDNLICRNTTGSHNIDILDSYSTMLVGCIATNALGFGIQIRGNSRGQILNSCLVDGNSSIGINIAGTASKIVCNDCIIVYNGSLGINVAATAGSVVIDGCTVSNNTTVGIDFDGTNNAVTNCIITSNGTTGIFAGDDGVINGNQVNNNGSVGIDVTTDTNVSVVGNRIQLNGSHGITAPSGTITNTIINHNFIAQNTGFGINCVVGTGYNISGNNIVLNTSGGIFGAAAIGADSTIAHNVLNVNGGADQLLWRGDNSTITGNRIVGDTGDIAINVTADNVVISSNRVDTAGTGTGISIGAGSDNCIVAANNYRNNGTSLSDSGTGTIIVGNT